MARTVAELPSGTRITDYISLGVITKSFPVDAIRGALESTGRTSIRQRDLPAHVVVYYVIALALYMQSSYREVLRCLLEGIKWLLGPGATLKAAGKSGISQARTRLGWEPLQKLHDEVVTAHRRRVDKRCMVPRLASRQSGRQHIGCRRPEGKRNGLRPPFGEPRQQRLSAGEAGISG